MRSLLFFSFILILSLHSSIYAQSEKGKIYMKLFSNFHTSYSNGKNTESAFEVQRAYLGYRYQMDEHFSANIKLDIGSPEQQSSYDLLKRYAYFKNAALKYERDALSIEFGLIDMYQFNVQEKYWGYRYIYKSFQDEHKFGSSADLGASISYTFNKLFHLDFAVMNGEGYNQLQTDKTFKTGMGLTITPWDNFKGRLYADFAKTSITQSTIAGFVGYQIKKWAKLGAEYNYQMNNAFDKNHNLYGLSFYSTIYLHEKIELFGRYDRLWSNRISGELYDWNIARDGSAIITGIQYTPVNKVRMAVNYQDWYPYPKNLEDETYFYLSLEYKL
mgnify:CR=1 FL=1